MKTHGILNAFQLKIIMLVLMLLDHMQLFLFPRELLPAHYVARVVAPVFAFLAAQGMVYTRNRLRFVLRLSLFGVIMALGNFILYLKTGYEIPNNIFFSLAIGAAAIYVIDELRQSKGFYIALWLAVVVILAFVTPYCEGGFLVPVIMLIFYYLRNRRPVMYAVYVIGYGLQFLMAYFNTGYLQPQFYMIFAVIPIMLYNGRRGPDTAFAKYLFYGFYPLHVWILFIISGIIAG
ncbi:MAG: conjugal transfer protein TraX [Oscillospiraceae bacterium]|nr:conjugal transfer protein TraX [Oscillospiraceae bacterium]